jgi:hypothetical protein
MAAIDVSARLRSSLESWHLVVTAARAGVVQLGRFARFALAVVGALPATVRRYTGEILTQFTDIAWGSGALIVGAEPSE